MRLLFSTLLTLGLLTSAAMSRERVKIVLPQASEGPAAYGVAQLAKALSKRDVAVEYAKTIEQADSDHVIVAGFAADGLVADLVRASGLALPTQPEALTIWRTRSGGRSTVVLCGGDAVGLMYAALDTAERIDWATTGEDLFAHVRKTVESPCLTDRSVSTYTMQRRLFEQRLYDAAYWEHYFDMLAKSRINSYVIVFGYENGGFMAPLYPYFFDVEGFPDVRLYGITDQQQTKNSHQVLDGAARHAVSSNAHQSAKPEGSAAWLRRFAEVPEAL